MHFARRIRLCCRAEVILHQVMLPVLWRRGKGEGNQHFLFICHNSNATISKVVQVSEYRLTFLRLLRWLCKQSGETTAQQAFRTISWLLDNFSGWSLSPHHPHRFSCIDMSEVVVFVRNRFCKLLARAPILSERVNLMVPLVRKTITQRSSGIVRRPSQSLGHIECTCKNRICVLRLH